MIKRRLNADAVREYRKRLGMSQRQAAHRAGWSVAQVWAKLEHRISDPRASTLALIARVLKCSMEDLLIEVDVKPRVPYRRTKTLRKRRAT